MLCPVNQCNESAKILKQSIYQPSLLDLHAHYMRNAHYMRKLLIIIFVKTFKSKINDFKIFIDELLMSLLKRSFGTCC